MVDRTNTLKSMLRAKWMVNQSTETATSSASTAKGEKMENGEYKHWCGNCQIRIYIQRHYGDILTRENCPYPCEYAAAMRCSTEAKGESDE